MTENIGFGSEEASHATDTHDEFVKKMINHHCQTILPLKHPVGIYTNTEADCEYAKMAQNETPSLVCRISRKILRSMGIND